MPLLVVSSPRTCQGSIACRSSRTIAVQRDRADQREAELEVRREPVALERVAGAVACPGSRPGSPARRSAAAGTGRAGRCPSGPAGRRTGFSQNLATRPRIRSCWARLIRACGGISKARSSTRPSRPLAESGLYSLSMQNSARCVLPVTSTSRWRKTRSTSQGGAAAAVGDLAEGDLQLVEAVVARLVEPGRLAVRADEQAREQVRQRRVVVPVGDQAAEQVGPAEERAVGRRRAAEDDVVAAAGAGVPAVEHELLGAQPRLPGLLVEDRGLRRPARPTSASGWMLTSITPGSGVI